ncbi:hypothetical protein BKA70DRAFT_1536422 [Coprinopsis sp. MPI-PUGE-AT-0042]|nr:hypothetical protein BKA70DRAFT_1536422 [Coprinopsis sp. MPI-PUGE-AT-0042]
MATAPESPQLPALSPVPLYMRGTPLPTNKWNPNSNNSEEGPWFKAYDTCLTLEANAVGVLDLIYARTLGYLLLYVPLDTGRTQFAREILECQANSPMLYLLAQNYHRHLLQAFCQSGSERSATSSPSNDSSGQSDDDSVTLQIVQAAKHAALRRDGLRCLLTGCHDCDYIGHCLENGLPIPEGPAFPTEATYIIPPYLNEIPQLDGGSKAAWSTAVWSQLKHFGVERDELDGDKIHRLGNIITLSVDLHEFFKRRSLWFDLDPHYGDDRHFVVHAYLAAVLSPNWSRRLALTNANPNTDNELPNARFLNAHGAVCRIAHMSGAADFMKRHDGNDSIYDSGTPVKATDGSTAEWLDMHLKALAISQHSPVNTSFVG